jgi:hypothetical protein
VAALESVRGTSQVRRRNAPTSACNEIAHSDSESALTSRWDSNTGFAPLRAAVAGAAVSIPGERPRIRSSCRPLCASCPVRLHAAADSSASRFAHRPTPARGVRRRVVVVQGRPEGAHLTVDPIPLSLELAKRGPQNCRDVDRHSGSWLTGDGQASRRVDCEVFTWFNMTEVRTPIHSDGFNLANGRSCGRVRRG